MSGQLEHDSANYYVWRPSDGFAVQLSLKVVSELSAQISRVGSEIQLSGILLGRILEIPCRTTVIEDFKLLVPTAQPDSEDAVFEIACRMGEAEQRPLGFFRVQRDGSLKMGRRDLQTFSRLFCENGNVALLIQPPRRDSESEAALFFWQGGEAHPRDFGFGFRFEASQLMGGHPGWRFPDPVDHTWPAATAPSGKPARSKWMAAAVSSSQERIQWARLLPTVGLVVVTIGALQLATNSNDNAVAADQSVIETAPPAPEPASDTGLGLTVTSRPHQLEIRWNRESAAIASSDSGVMRITEAGTTEAVPFDQSQLRDGYVAYTPTTNDVSVRLEVKGKDGGTKSESVRSVAIP